ncbi:MAG: AsmA-like C-terminal region-containing protein [Pseudomonadota bacterium]
MTETEDSKTAPAGTPSGRARAERPAYSARRRSGLLVVVAAAVVLATLGGLSALILRGSVVVPEPVVAILEDRVRSLTPGRGIVQVGSIEIGLSEAGRPQIVARNTVLRAPGGLDRLVVPHLEVTLSRRALLRAELRPIEIRIDGAALRITRREDGFLRVALQSGETLTEGPSLPAIIAQIEDIFAQDPLNELEQLNLSNLSLQVVDGRLARGITLSGGDARVNVDPRSIVLALALDLEGAPAGAGAALRFETERNAPDTRMTMRLRELPAPLLSRQSPAFAALAAFDGTVTARLDGALAPDGAISELAGGVDLGPGNLAVPWQEAPVQITQASLELGYDPALSRFEMSGLEVISDLGAGRFNGSVDVLPSQGASLWPDIQFALAGDIERLKLTPKLREDAEDVGFSLDGRFSAATRRIDLGTLQVIDHQSGARGTGSGRIDLPKGGKPELALELHVPHLPATRVPGFFPTSGRGHKLGRWLASNILEGTATDGQVALRLMPGAPPEIALTFAYEDARVQVLEGLPSLTSAHGHASLFDNRFFIRVGDGEVKPEGFAAVSVSGSSFEILDTRIPGTDARIRLDVFGDTSAIIDVLQRPPVRVGERFKLPPQGIAGQTEGSADFLIALAKDAPFDLDQLRIKATMTDAEIAGLAPDIGLSQGTLALDISGPDLALSGTGQLADLPVSFGLDARLDGPPGAARETIIAGEAQVSEAGLASVGIVLPAGRIGEGTATAEYALTLPGDEAPPRLTVSSDLAGVSISVPEIGWTKPAREAGLAEVDLALSQPPELDRIVFEFAGLSAQGRLRLEADGAGLAWAQMDRFSLGNWSDLEVELVGRGPGTAPTIAVTGGRIDLRDLPPRAASQSNSGAGAFALQLDEVIVSETLRLSDVSGTLQFGSVVSGTLSGSLNARAPVRIELGPGPNGRQLVRVTANDGGATLAAAGILANLRGGPMELVLEETASPGGYAGQLKLANTRLVESPASVELLSALSIVGLLEQLANGGGIGLTEVSADFRITPEGVSLRDGLANGPSLGLTFEGVVMPKSDQIDLQGVVSPVYIINSLGGGLLGTPNEGLIGVTYRIAGSRDSPEISVNPLSVLTPGIFRDLFRRPPPQLTQ